jgi:hypothetical protein
MPGPLWADVSEYQCVVTDNYPHPVLAIRANDGTYVDKNFAANYAWARTKLDTGTLSALIVYLVYRPNWAQTLATTMAVVGTPHPKLVVMIDVESWDGQIIGDHSSSINSLYWGLGAWIGNQSRVIGYGNVGDLNNLWPTKPTGIQLVIAAYGTKPSYPGMIGHQFADDYTTNPFGPCDINTADEHTVESFCAALSLGSARRRSLEDYVPWRLNATSEPLLRKSAAPPDNSWTAEEDTISLPGPVGGWPGRELAHVTFGNGGAWIQEAWWAPSGNHAVPPVLPNVSGGGLSVGQFVTLTWEAPTGSLALIIRYAAPAGGSVGIETQN